MRKPLYQLLLTWLITAISPTALAVVSEELLRENFRASICNIQSMSVNFKIDEAFGEPLITSKMRWAAGPNTTPDCLSNLTYIWVRVRTPFDTIRYIKLSPEVQNAGADFGPTATESPNWGILFCEAPDDSASCEPASAAKSLFADRLTVDGFEVVTEARTLTASQSRASDRAGERKLSNDDFSLDSLLADAVDDALGPGSKAAPPAPQEPVLTAAEQAELLENQREELARTAVNNVVTLIASSLAQYTTPAHGCESDRVVANWVQARGTCQLNFRSEANHEFTCSEGGESSQIRATRRANIDLTRDVSRVAPIRVSKDGWASVVLELRDELRATTEGNYKTNRWQFTARTDQLEDLKQLASSILTLKEYCEASKS
ncbi:MAG: hypothetical protein ACFHX7_02535 [Pseudomonadota bacterium]